MALLLDYRPRGIPMTALRLPIWAGLTAQTVLSTHGLTSRIGAGVLMGVSAVSLQFLASSRLTVSRAAFFAATGCGLAACYFASGGTAEIPVFVAATRIPEIVEDRALRVLVVLDAVAVAFTIGWISGNVILALVGLAVPVLVQRSMDHRDLVRERDRAQALLAEVQAGREAESQAVALRERGRIARDMHDVLAHSLAGLSVQLQAARALAAREGVAVAVIEPIDRAAALARDGLAEARAAVGALRDPLGLGLDALPALVARHPAEVSLRSEGVPGAVSVDAGHAVYRAVQEALTNAARYAPGSAVTVQLRWRADGLDVLVHDTGPARDREIVSGAGSGLGLAGMDERLRQVGGSVQAGPAPAGPGWRVTLTVPLSRDFDPLVVADRDLQRPREGQSGE